MTAIDAGKEKAKGMKPVVDGFGDGRYQKHAENMKCIGALQFVR